jgi:glycosyltransferase involved in cell wall biosynthesis
MIYFGRIAPEKNIELIINVVSKLEKQNHKCSLTILGNYSSKTKIYYENLKKLIRELNLQQIIKIVPPCNHDELKLHLKDKHLYLFPSNNPREGHSNALTEAMAWGLVPLAIDHGFNKSVINNDFLIVKELEIDLFYKKIVEIIQTKRLDELSSNIYQRVQENYTENILLKKIEKEYESLFGE